MFNARTKFLAAGIAAAAGLAAAAKADPITIKFDGTGLGRTVHVTSPTATRDLFAGQLKHSYKNADPAVFGQASGSFTSFCADISQYVNSSYTTFLTTGAAGMPMPGGQLTSKGAALEGIFAFAGSQAIASNSSPDLAAAFELAIWEIEHDYDPTVGVGSLSLTSGNFQAAGPGGSALSSAIATEFSTLIGHIHDPLSGPQSVVGLASSNYQDQLTIVPAPGALAVGALGGLLMARRHRRTPRPKA